MPPQMTAYIRAILEQGHYVMVITNGVVTKRFDEIVLFPKELLERLCFKFSFHYRELKTTGSFLDAFFSNVEKVRKAGCSFSIELTPSDDDIPFIDEIMNVTKNRAGAYCHITVARDETSPLHDKPILTKLSPRKYERTWGVFDSDMFRYKLSVFGQKRKEFCYAGAWSGYLNLGTGSWTQCYSGFTQPQNIFEDPTSRIKKVPVGKFCCQPHCYNAHAFLTLGLIPELDSIEYARIRNKIADDGSEWLNQKVKAFLSNKLKTANREYSSAEKLWHGVRYSSKVLLAEKFIRKLVRKIFRS